MRSLTAAASLFTRVSLLKPQIGCNTLNVGANARGLASVAVPSGSTHVSTPILRAILNEMVIPDFPSGCPLRRS
jgi:hypothetical protein